MLLTIHGDSARERLALAGDDLDQFALPIARDAGDTDDLSFPHGEVDAVKNLQTVVAPRPQVFDAKNRASGSSADRRATSFCTRGSPIIISAIRDASRLEVFPAPAKRPRRRTVTSSQYSMTSRNLCVISRTLSSRCSTSRRTKPSTSSASLRVRTEVGSSRISNRVCKVEFLEDLDLLLLSGGKRLDPGLEIHLKRRLFEKGSRSCFFSAFQSITKGRSGPSQNQVLRHGHRGNQREVLEHHAESVAAGLARGIYASGLPVNQDLACVGVMEAHQAFDDGALARAVLAQQGMEGAGRNFDRDVVKSFEGAEMFGDSARFEVRGFGFARSHFLPKAPGIPASLRLGVQVAIMTPRVNRYGDALNT